MDEECRKRFLQGIADVIGSCEPTHRNRSDATPIVSFEVKAKNYDLTMEICHLMYSLGIATDQILWNHPNQHAGKNANTKSWKKGNKVRVRSTDFAKVGFSLECKKIGLEKLLKIGDENRKGPPRQKGLCPVRRYSINGMKVHHPDESSEYLPKALRRHFIHYTDICEALGCPYAPHEWLNEKRAKYS